MLTDPSLNRVKERRNELREENCEDPEIPELTMQIEDRCKEAGKKVWEEKLRKADLRHNESSKPY